MPLIILSRLVNSSALQPSSRRLAKAFVGSQLWQGRSDNYHVGTERLLFSFGTSRRNFSSSTRIRQTMAKWSHRPCEGCLAAAEWGKGFEAANGKRQSPIDLKDAEYDEELSGTPLTTKYADAFKCELVNTGKSVQVNFKPSSGVLSGGPLSDTFEILQYHFHWGSCNAQGSEHTVDGKTYPIELHLVHWNKQKFKTAGEAMPQPNGLAVLGIFLEIGAENIELKKITELFDKIKFKDQSVEVEDAIRLAGLLPKDTKSFWTYPGSLTTPPCFESVNWIVFRDTITLSNDQMMKFRHLHETEVDSDPTKHKCLVDNFRPVLPLNDRTLRTTFKK